jgi:uncharacterized protein (DUF58 family)
VIRPTRMALWLVAAGTPFAFAPTLLHARLWPLWAAFVIVVVLLLALDALLMTRPRALRIEVTAPARILVGRGESLRVAVVAPRRKGRGLACGLELLVPLGEPFEPVAPVAGTLPAGGTLEFGVPLDARRRGTARVEALWLRLAGPLRLVARTWTHPIALELRCVPDLAGVRAEALRFLGARTAQSGIKIERYEGDGTEFDALRTFVPGFDVRRIDWKSSARHRRLMSRKFRAERNHQVLLAFDTGHLMGERLGRLPRLDHAIHAGLLLGYVGLRTGDRVGLCGFDAGLRTFVPPAGGMRAFARLVTHSSELAYGTDETNFTLSLMQLSARLRRRSLVVVFSDFVDSVTAELMVDNLERIGRRHLVLFVCSPDPTLELLREDRPADLVGLCKAVVASDVERERRAVLQRLRRAGVLVVDAPYEHVSTRLLGRYLEIRRRELVG